MGFSLVVGLGHNGRGEEHVTQGAALVSIHLCLCTFLQEERRERWEKESGGGQGKGSEKGKRLMEGKRNDVKREVRRGEGEKKERNGRRYALH